jgi:hypothetical protein
MATKTISIDVIDNTIPILNNKNIPVINQPNPCYGYSATAKEVKFLIQLSNYYVYEAGTNNIINGNNYYTYFPEESGGSSGGGGGTEITVDEQVTSTSTNPVQNKAIYEFVNNEVNPLKSDLDNKANTSDVYTKTETDNKILSKVAEIVADAPEDFDTLKEMSDWIASHENSAAEMNSAIQTNKTDILSKVNTADIPSLTQAEYDALTEKTAMYYFIKEE